MKYDPALHHRRSIRLRGYDYSQAGAYFITICTHHRRCIFGHIENQEMVLNEYGQVAYREWEKLPARWPQVELGAFQIMPNHVHGIIIIRDVAFHVGAPLAGAQHPDAPLAGAHPDAPLAGAQPTAPLAGAQHPDAPLAGAQGVEHVADADDDARATGVPARGTPTEYVAGAQGAEHVTGAQRPGEHVAGAQRADDPATGVPVTGTPTDDPVTAARATGVPARGTPTGVAGDDAPPEMRVTQIQWATKPTAGQIVGAYQSCVSTGCLKIAKSKQPEQMLGKLWQRNFWEHIIRDVRAFDTISHYIIMNPAHWETDKLYHVE